MVHLRQLAREDDVPVEDGARLVGDGFGHVVALDEYRVEGGDRSLRRVSGALHEFRQLREHARRESAPRRRLAGGQSDFALGAPEARYAVHHEQHPHAPVAERLGDGRGHVCGLEALHRRAVGRGNDEHGLLHALRPEVFLDELAHLAPALADERQHRHLRLRVADD